jgi:RNA 3'-terminal phosphate cyclase (ATP)
VPGLGGWAGSVALGARGQPAEEVGREAGAAFRAFVQSGAAVDLHLADQLLLYAALADGPSELSVEQVTEHTRTNLWVIEQFLGPRFAVREAGPAIVASPSRR